MNEIVARATIETDNMVNTGFIHMKEKVIEGIFSLDYVKITLDGQQMFLHLNEQSFYTFSHFLMDTTNFYCYFTSYPYSTLYIPDTYSLYDEAGSVLTLSLEEVIQNPEEISEILMAIEQVKT